MITERMQRKGRHKELDDGDIKAIYNACRLKSKGLVLFLWLTGCRISEALEMHKVDVSYNHPYYIFKVPTKKHGVILEQRPIYVREDHPFMERLKIYLDVKEGEESLWNMHRITAWRHITEAGQLAGVGKVWLHFIRHSRLTDYANKGGTANELKKFAGWTHIYMADVYCREHDAATKNLADKDMKKVT